MARRDPADGALTRRPASPRLVRAAVVLAGVAVLAAVAPRVESVPDDDPGGAAPELPPEESLVRVRHAGRSLVYDKRKGWASAKAAEWFPSAVPHLVPADYVETGAGELRRRRVELHAPWWRRP